MIDRSRAKAKVKALAKAEAEERRPLKVYADLDMTAIADAQEEMKWVDVITELFDEEN